MAKDATPTLALVGSPNSGKTALFNALTGLNHKVANYPGVTVDWAEGMTRKNYGPAMRVIDLPGTYSLHPQSEDELLTREVLCGEGRRPVDADLILCVADSCNLNLHLRLVLEVLALGRPTVLAVTMIDQAERINRRPDIKLLEEALGIPVIAVSAIKDRGLDQLMQVLQNTWQEDGLPKKPNLPSNAIDRLSFVASLLGRVLPDNEFGRLSLSDQLDRWLLHPKLGLIFLALVFMLVFQAIFAWAAIPQEWIEQGIGVLGQWVSSILPDGLWRSLIVDGMISGVGNVVVFLPQILILFLFLLILEDSGYMARAAFLLDRLMRGVGLNGRSVLPLVSGFACAIPSIMSSRIMGHRRERWATILIIPLMTCSARLPVYTLLIGTFIPEKIVLGLFNLRGLVLFGLYAGGLLSALLVAYIIQKFGWIAGKSTFVMELPSYRLPSWPNLLRGLYDRGMAFLNRAGTFILAVMVVLWFLATFPMAPAGASLPAINYSFAGQLGHFLEPVFAPLGWNWKIVVALIPGFAAREVLVSALGMVYAIDATIGEDQQIAALSSVLPGELSLAAAIALLVWYIFAPQCFATFAVMQRETRSWRLTVAGFSYLLVLAYGAALLAHSLVTWLS